MQTPVLFEGTVRDNSSVRAGHPLRILGREPEETLGEVGLEATLLDRDAATLSGGEKQRVTIARALLRDPRRCSWTSRPPRSTRPTRPRSGDDLAPPRSAAGSQSSRSRTMRRSSCAGSGGALLYLVGRALLGVQQLYAGGA